VKTNINFSYILLFLILFLIYQPVLITDYLMNDEIIWIGSNMNIWEAMQSNFIKYGRGLFGLYHALVYKFVDYSPFKIQIIRFLNLVGVYGLASLFFRFCKSSFSSTAIAFFLTLFFISHPSIQGILGYSLQIISNFQPSAWLSIFAFYIYFYWSPHYPVNQLLKALKIVLTIFIFILALQSTQTYAFLCMIPLSLGILTNSHRFTLKKSLVFCLLAFICLFISAISYKFFLSINPNLSGYKLGVSTLNDILDSPFQALKTGLNPSTYIDTFRVWNYPFGFHQLVDLDRSLKSFGSFLIFYCVTIVNLLAFSIETFKAAKLSKKLFKKTIGSWTIVTICLSFGALFVFLESPLQPTQVRPHMALTLIGVITVITTYSSFICRDFLKTLINFQFKSITYIQDKNWRKFQKLLGLFLASIVIFITIGAQSNTLRNIVNVRAQALGYVRVQLMAKPKDSWQKVIVVKSKDLCVFEPCEAWMGSVIHGRWLKNKGGYQYAMASIGIDPSNKNIMFIQASQLMNISIQKAIIIDWNQYLQANKQYKQRIKQQ